jgi:hypothetical protein
MSPPPPKKKSIVELSEMPMFGFEGFLTGFKFQVLLWASITCISVVDSDKKKS